MAVGANDRSRECHPQNASSTQIQELALTGIAPTVTPSSTSGTGCPGKYTTEAMYAGGFAAGSGFVSGLTRQNP